MPDLGLFLQFIGSVTGPASMVGGVIFIFFYLKKQEAELRKELSDTLKRLQADKAALYIVIDKLELEASDRETIIDRLRISIRNAEDDAIFQRRRADRAEAQLENIFKRDQDKI